MGSFARAPKLERDPVAKGTKVRMYGSNKPQGQSIGAARPPNVAKPAFGVRRSRMGWLGKLESLHNWIERLRDYQLKGIGEE